MELTSIDGVRLDAAVHPAKEQGAARQGPAYGVAGFRLAHARHKGEGDLPSFELGRLQRCGSGRCASGGAGRAGRTGHWGFTAEVGVAVGGLRWRET